MIVDDMREALAARIAGGAEPANLFWVLGASAEAAVEVFIHAGYVPDADYVREGKPDRTGRKPLDMLMGLQVITTHAFKGWGLCHE